ncbi:mediator of RNA polymerase II transcription subunit 4 [Paenibacillus vandeheii]
MYKFAPLLLSVTFLMTGCSGSDKSVEALKSMELNQENMQTIKELREDNARLQEQIAQIQENVHSEELRNNLRETLNMTFKLIAAMESEDTAYIESVSSPNVDISTSSDTLIIHNTGHSYEVNFIKGIQWDEFEFRGYNQKDTDHFMLFIAQHITTKGSEGNIAYEFSFVRSPEGNWLFDGYVS